MPSSTSPPGKSFVRVKAVVVFTAFLGCWIAVLYGSTHGGALLAVAGAAAVLLYFVRCESCHSSIYYRAGGERTLFFGPRASLRGFGFLASGRCPYCGLERF
jgi:hypothetical protein